MTGERHVLHVEGMSCQHCVRTIEAALKEVEGVRDADVSLETQSVWVISEGAVDPTALVRAVEEAGYSARLEGGE